MRESSSPRNLLSVCSLSFLLASLIAGTVNAQPRPGYDPSSTHIFPAGARRGTTVQVRVGTECVPPRTRFFVMGEGIQAPAVLGAELAASGEPSPRRLPTEIPITYPREWSHQVQVLADAPLGTAHWYLHCAQGGTQVRPFVIGELPEFIEQESNSTAARAEAIELPITVNGQISGERDVDYFVFTASRGEIVSCEVVARRLGSLLDPVISILDEQGQAVASQAAYSGDDPVRVFTAAADGKYLLRISNVSFHGSPAHIYRINLQRKPYVVSAHPAGGLPGGQQSLAVGLLTGDQIQQAEFSIQLPVDGQEYYELRDEQRFAGHVKLSLDVQPARRESEFGDEPVNLPLRMHGRFESDQDVDELRFRVQAGQRYELTCRRWPPESLGSPCLTLSASEAVLTTQRSIDQIDGVCRFVWTAEQDQVCRLELRDLRFGARGDFRHSYEVSIAPSQPGFEVQAVTDLTQVEQGGKAGLNVSIRRSSGFNDPVMLRVEGLPDNVQVEGLEIPAGKSDSTISFSVAESVGSTVYPLTIYAWAEIEGTKVQRRLPVRHQTGDSEGVTYGAQHLPQTLLAVRHKPLFTLECSEAYQYAHRGSVHSYQMEIERLNGFAGEIVVQRGDRQNRDMDGIEMWTTTVGASESVFDLPIYLPETMHINVQSQSQLYSQAFALFEDEHGNEQSVLVLATKRNMLRTLPPVVKLRTAAAELALAAGGTAECELLLERTSNFLGPMQIELICSHSGVRIESVPFAAGKDRTRIPITVSADVGPLQIPVTWRATGQLDAATQIISEAQTVLAVRPAAACE